MLTKRAAVPFEVYSWGALWILGCCASNSICHTLCLWVLFACPSKGWLLRSFLTSTLSFINTTNNNHLPNFKRNRYFQCPCNDHCVFFFLITKGYIFSKLLTFWEDRSTDLPQPQNLRHGNVYSGLWHWVKSPEFPLYVITLTTFWPG